jgi:TatD DNase family protein
MLIDTHAHLDDSQFDDDRADVVNRARQSGIEAVIAIGTTAGSSEATVRLAGEHEGVFAAVGIQPNECAAAQPGDWDRIVALVERPGVVAIGETGLDRFWDFTPFEMQQDYFDRHIRLAVERSLPLVIHMRDCDIDMLDMVRRQYERTGPLAGVMHSFTGDESMAAECANLGLHISFAGMVTFKKSDQLRAVAAGVPRDRILIETDSPYLAPHPLRGKRNEPANVVHTARCLAEVCGESFETFAERVTANARRLFRLPAT